MFYHRENMSLTGEEINRFVVDFFVNMERHKNFIKQEFEKRFAEGRMNKRTRGDQERDVLHHILFMPAATQQRPQPPVRTPRRRLRMTPQEQRPVQDEFDEVQDELSFDEMSNEFPELLDCFSSEGFDPGQFEHFARNFLRQIHERTDMNPEDVEKEKTRIVFALAQNIYVMCTLSKGQMKAITSFWKAMIAFLSPEAGAAAKKIRVSYSSCVRQAQKRYEETQERHRQMFEDCVHFSIALDTSQFGRDNFVSCVGRFGFEDRISQEILFLDKVTASTGREMARFIFEKLDEKCGDFSKLVSITTDGASNVVSQECGLANELIKIINEKR